MRHKIFVTKQDIELGRPTLENHCPIALALKRKFNTINAWVDGVDIQLENKKYQTPQKCEQFIVNFDKGRKVKPFSFCLNIEGIKNEL